MKTGNICVSVLLVVMCCVPSMRAGQWPQFRGPQSNQLCRDMPLPEVWSPNQNVQWRMPLPGRAWSSPVVWGDRIFITTAVDETLEASGSPARAAESGSRIKPTNDYRWEVRCLDIHSGKTLWAKVAAQGKPTMTIHKENTYASETPVTDGKRIFAFFGNNGIYCYDFEGRLCWKKDLGIYPMKSDWGTSSSPLIHNGLVYLQVDNEEQSFLVALEAETGAERWRVSREGKSTWSTPIIWKNSLRTELVAGGNVLRGYDPLSGDVLWELSVGGGRCSASPTAAGDVLYFGTEKRKDGGFLFAVKAGANGDITPKPEATTSAGVLWSQPDAGVAFASPLVYRGLVYILERNHGGIKCFDAQTGEPVYSERLPDAGIFWATPWPGGDRIYCLDVKGTTYVVQAGREFKLIHQNKLNDAFYASCAFTGNAMVLRGEESLYCIRGDSAGIAESARE